MFMITVECVLTVTTGLGILVLPLRSLGLHSELSPSWDLLWGDRPGAKEVDILLPRLQSLETIVVVLTLCLPHSICLKDRLQNRSPGTTYPLYTQSYTLGPLVNVSDLIPYT